jgi:hypothetical protein
MFTKTSWRYKVKKANVTQGFRYERLMCSPCFQHATMVRIAFIMPYQMVTDMRVRIV